MVAVLALPAASVAVIESTSPGHALRVPLKVPVSVALAETLAAAVVLVMRTVLRASTLPAVPETVVVRRKRHVVSAGARAVIALAVGAIGATLSCTTTTRAGGLVIVPWVEVTSSVLDAFGISMTSIANTPVLGSAGPDAAVAPPATSTVIPVPGVATRPVRW